MVFYWKKEADDKQQQAANTVMLKVLSLLLYRSRFLECFSDYMSSDVKRVALRCQCTPVACLGLAFPNGTFN